MALSGFTLRSRDVSLLRRPAPDAAASVFGVFAWDHDADAAGLVVFGTTLAPSDAASTA